MKLFINKAIFDALSETEKNVIAYINNHEQDILNQIEELQNDLIHIREKVRYYAAVENAVEKSEPIPEWHQFFANEKNSTENNKRQN